MCVTIPNDYQESSYVGIAVSGSQDYNLSSIDVEVVINVQSVTLSLPNVQATHRLGALFGKQLSPGSVILLEGDLGAGKTTLVGGIGAGLGIAEPIVSPTFTLINEYTGGRLPLYHLDLYRLEPSEIEALYLETYWEGIEVAPGITVIEWSERLPDKPDDYLNIQLVYTADEGREASITATKFYSDLWRSLTEKK